MMPVRILHVIGGMDRGGGIQTYLMNVLRHIDRTRFHMDFATVYMRGRKGAFDDEIRALGSRVYSCSPPGHPWRFLRDLRHILRTHGPYHVVHSHLPYITGFILKLAAQESVPIRIAHSHNDHTHEEATASRLRRLYIQLMKRQIARHATIGLGCSRQAVLSMFGPDWQRDPRYRVLLYGLDFTAFHQEPDPAARQELGLPQNAFVIGHIGRFVEQKNHAFLLEVVAEVATRIPDTYLLLLGDGPLRGAIEAQAEALGLKHRMIMAGGARPDVPRIMLSAMDVFVLPSRFEGLGLVLVEAQAAGLPSVYSDVVPQEADIVHPLLKRLSLQCSASTWADTIVAHAGQPAPVPRPVALDAVEQSAFNICTSVHALEKVYAGQS
ncbi:MAG: glycosyltransferase [Chloroherpetonaceae bacterium]|nr:glycosyltransferase [Chthonomonadaceae bacterium]MDW8206690.1 glycosyltransferase [Chloroherpetonaceae bacterium]